jgi:hypothetical protein
MTPGRRASFRVDVTLRWRAAERDVDAESEAGRSTSCAVLASAGQIAE